MDRSLLLLLVLLLPVLSSSQQNATPPQLQPRAGGPSKAPADAASVSLDRRITLDVQVTDKSGAPVRGLQLQDFTVLDDKQPQKIISFQSVDVGAPAPSDPPAEIVLVIDGVNTAFNGDAYERGEVKKFLLQNGGKLAQPVSLIFFSDSGAKVEENSSRDGNAQAALFDQYETEVRTINRSQGFYGAAERYDLSLKTLSSLVEQEEARPGRKLMIWFSPGWPLLSGPNVELTRKDEQAFFNSIVAISTGLRRARITLYNVSPQGPANAGRIESTFYENFLQGVTAAEHAQPGDLGLQVLAVQSGGRVFNTTNDVTSALASCASDANSFYVLSFDGARADQPDEYHSLAIKIDKPKVTARTRTGYYAQPGRP
jgi:VWFA-related protein